MRDNNDKLIKYAQALKTACEEKSSCDRCVFHIRPFDCAIGTGRDPSFWDIPIDKEVEE